MGKLGKTPSCFSCGLRDQGLFGGLDKEHLVNLEQAKRVRRYDRGQLVFDEGESPEGLYCICAGIVKLYKFGHRDEEVVLRLLRPGDVMGYRPILSGETFAASARAVTEASVCIFSKDTIFGLLSVSPDLSKRLMIKLATELRVSEEEMVARVSQSVSQRVARFLLWMSTDLAALAAPPKDINVSLRREDMAHVIGTTPETLSRVLHELQRQDLVSLDRHAIRIRDKARLARMAHDAAQSGGLRFPG